MPPSRFPPSPTFNDSSETHGDDLWGCTTWAVAFNEQRFAAATEMLSGIGRNFQRGLEIGCAQDAMTEWLAPLCELLLAVDFVPVALERARARCQGSNISFTRWDLKVDPVPGQFDLIAESARGGGDNAKNLGGAE
jgi:hypothetical protein